MRLRSLLVVSLGLFLGCAHRYQPRGRPVPYEGFYATFPSGLRLVVYEVPHVDRFAVTVSYGSGSAERFRARAEKLGVRAATALIPNLVDDVDTLADLERLEGRLGPATAAALDLLRLTR